MGWLNCSADHAGPGEPTDMGAQQQSKKRADRNGCQQRSKKKGEGSRWPQGRAQPRPGPSPPPPGPWPCRCRLRRSKSSSCARASLLSSSSILLSQPGQGGTEVARGRQGVTRRLVVGRTCPTCWCLPPPPAPAPPPPAHLRQPPPTAQPKPHHRRQAGVPSFSHPLPLPPPHRHPRPHLSGRRSCARAALRARPPTSLPRLAL